MTGITLPITKHNYLITSADEIAEAVHEAFFIARSGRPGPVLLDICKNAQLEQVEVESLENFPATEIALPGFKPPVHAPQDQLRQAAELIAQSERPVILAGHGVLISDAVEELAMYARKTNTPVAKTLLGLTSFPASHPLSLGMMGMHGEAFCNNAIQQADLLLAFGMRFDDRVTGNLRTYAPRARKIHIEIDPSEIHKNVTVDVSLAGDLKAVLGDLIPLVTEQEHTAWMCQIDEWRGRIANARHPGLGRRWQAARSACDPLHLPGDRRPGDRYHRRRSEPDVERPILPGRPAQAVYHLWRVGHDGISGFPLPSAPGSPIRGGKCGLSLAMAGSR